jgi:hypothetical protein
MIMHVFGLEFASNKQCIFSTFSNFLCKDKKGKKKRPKKIDALKTDNVQLAQNTSEDFPPPDKARVPPTTSITAQPLPSL